MKVYYNHYNNTLARKLRSNMTDAESVFWNKVRRKQICNIQFYRQRPIDNYIVDFVSLRHKLIIEIDGAQHYEANEQSKDKQREEVLQKLGYMIIRYNDHEILTNIEGVIEHLENIVKSLPASL